MVQILDAESVVVVEELSGHEAGITDLEWLGPDILATASLDKTIRIWKPWERGELKVLEAEGTVVGISYSAALDCLTGWTPSEYVVWSVQAGRIASRTTLPVSANFGYRYASASRRDSLLVRLEGPELTNIAFSHGWDAHRGHTPASVSSYANAKVLLLGDSGVGKSGLALVLAGEPFRPTESTHARHMRSCSCPLPTLTAARNRSGAVPGVGPDCSPSRSW
jgi:WD40 repeat protein